MLTIFTVPKPFEGRIGPIQRNAIRSWVRLGPDCQVIICGNEAGCREIADEFKIDLIEEVDHNEFGTPLLSSVFRRVEERARHEQLLYVNADLILFSDLCDAIRRISSASDQFLAVGQTLNLDMAGETFLEDETAVAALRSRALIEGQLRGRLAMDFFGFPRGTIGQLPDFVVGRPAWDNWMIWRARSLRIPVVDISPSAVAIHQAHDYSHVSRATGHAWEGPEANRNRSLLEFPERLFSLDDTTHRLTEAGLVPNRIGLKRRIRTELTFRSWTIPLHRALQPANRLLRKLPSTP